MKITISSVSKIIHHTAVLNDISCQFSSGNIYGIVGLNGSGKTMLLRTICGLLVPTTGTVVIDGKTLHKDISFPPNLGMIIEKPEFLSYLSGYENLKQISDIKKIASDETIKEYMQIFALDPASRQAMRKYSLGMKQKIGIIQAIMENPDILVLDEPFNALDEQSVLLFRKLLLQFKRDGKLIILTSHNKEDIEAICNEIVMLKNGKVASDNH